MNLLEVVDATLGQVTYYLQKLDQDRYVLQLEILSQASIGQHTRHIIEFYECLCSQAQADCVNYDLRQRNHAIETQPNFALKRIEAVHSHIRSMDLNRSLSLSHNYDPSSQEVVSVTTTLGRELLYNIEHTIHHLAMIKIGLKTIAPDMELPADFGVAPSTIKYQKVTKS